MAEITVDELVSTLMRSTGLSVKQTARFLEAVSGSLDHELANRAEDVAAVPISIPEKLNLFTFGIVPEATLVDSIFASTGIPRASVLDYLDKLDDSVRPHLSQLEEPLRLGGFGTIAPQGKRLVYSPVAFEQLHREPR